jgi:hypothetical protein
MAAILISTNKIIISAASVLQDMPPIPSAWIFELDTVGEIMWQYYYPDSILFEGNDIIEISEGSLMVAGSALAYPRDFAIIKLSSTGTLLWNKTLGEQDIHENAARLLHTSDEGFVIAGEKEYEDFVKIVKINKEGEFEWSKEYGLWQVRDINLIDVNGNEFVLFYTDRDPATQEGYQIFIKKFDLAGNVIWENRCSVPSAYGEVLSDVVKLEDGTFLSISLDGVLTAIDTFGEKLWQDNANLTYKDIYEPYTHSLEAYPDSSIVLGGLVAQNNGGDISVAMFTKNNPTTAREDTVARDSYGLLQNYPNPFNAATTIVYRLPSSDFVTIDIYNIIGQKIDTLVNDYKTSGEHVTTWFSEGLPSGIYFYKLKVGDIEETKMLVLQK